jgi:uncharacterized coiled-coil DUF342 family protein
MSDEVEIDWVKVERERLDARLAKLDDEIGDNVTKREFHNAEVKRLRAERKQVDRLLRATRPRPRRA